jgi:hypothetical protein
MPDSKQILATHVKITVDSQAARPIQVTPDPVNLCYLHGGVPGHDDRPHHLVWDMAGLQPGEKVEILLKHADGLRYPKEHDRVVRSLFRHSTLPDGRHGAMIESGPAHQPNKSQEKFTLKYDVVLTDKAGNVHTLDPSILLEPDP